jgi:hypothetical protein
VDSTPSVRIQHWVQQEHRSGRSPTEVWEVEGGRVRKQRRGPQPIESSLSRSYARAIRLWIAKYVDGRRIRAIQRQLSSTVTTDDASVKTGEPCAA